MIEYKNWNDQYVNEERLIYDSDGGLIAVEYTDGTTEYVALLNRLAAYEDTGLEPEEIGSLKTLRRVKTNADKYFRNATDEELAERLSEQNFWNCPPRDKTCPGDCHK